MKKLGFDGLMTVVVVLIGVGGLISMEAAPAPASVCFTHPSNPEIMNSIRSKLDALTTSKFQNRKLKWSMEDYSSVDPVPVPSSTASIRPGPIQHGAPQIPYIPRPSAPDPPPSSSSPQTPPAIVEGGLG